MAVNQNHTQNRRGVIFITLHSINDPMLSFMMPFDLITNLTVEQPVFAANFIKGSIRAAPDGGWEGQATFKLVFRNGGAIEFAQLMVKAASAAARGFPLRTLNDWFSSIRIYVITGEGNVCTPQMPCSVIVYGAPPPGYGAPPAGYEAPPPGYVALPAGYEALPAGYEAPPPGYGAPPAGNEDPSVGYRASPAGYGATPPEYRAAPAGPGATPHESAAAQTPENEASLPSPTSSHVHS
uniref:WBP2 N-terminal like n=1 Tax=Cebus imitator TaxID=2715852 RepID=A0A2K5QZT4_CEBIM